MQSMDQPCEVIVFDKSHKIFPFINIHECLKIKMVFPKEKNMFILFTGHTAHNGAAAIEEPEVTSFNFMNSLHLHLSNMLRN